MFPSSWRQQDGHCSGYKTGSVPLTRLRRIVFPRAQFFFSCALVLVISFRFALALPIPFQFTPTPS